MRFSDLGIEERSDKIRYSTTCPKCSHLRKKSKTPCLTVNNEEGNRWFNCSHCGFSGNLDVYEKYNKVREKSKMPAQLPEIYSPEVMAYWKKRGIDYRIALKEKIFEYKLGDKTILGFPYYQGFTLVNVKYLNINWKSPDDGIKWWQLNKSEGTKTIPWGLNTIQFNNGECKVITITEGEIDRLTWLSAGYKNVISEPQGAPSPEAKDFKEKFLYFDDPYFKQIISEAESFILSTDADEAGKTLRDQLGIRLGKEKCKFVNYPPHYKDINEVWAGDERKNLKALGKEGVDECYRNLSSFPVKGIIKLIDDREDLEKLANKGLEPGLKIGIEAIDRLYTTKQERLEVIVGLPGSGKSVYKRWHTTELIRHNDKLNLKFALFTPENRPTAREKSLIAEIITGQAFKRGLPNSMSEIVREKTLKYIDEHFFFISPDRKNFESWDNEIKDNQVNTLRSILKYLEYLKKTENIFGYIIDAWNKIDHEQPKYLSDTNFISKQLDYLLDFNAYYKLHGSLIVHPTKIEMSGLNYRMPNLYDAKGSSAWKEKADIGIILHRYTMKRKPQSEIPIDADEEDKYYYDINAPLIVKTEKIRFEEEGNHGKVKLLMNYSKGRRFEVVPEKKEVNKLNPKLKKDLKEEEEEYDDIFIKRSERELPF